MGFGAKEKTDFLVIGSGIAGMSLALKLSALGRVCLVAKSNLLEGASFYAQGGIASVLGSDDSFDQHVQDTLRAGDGLCHEEIVKRVVEAGPKAIKELIELGADFTTLNESGASLHLTQEGGHSRRRVIHAADATGKEVVRALAAKVNADPNIRVLERQFAVDLVTTDKYGPRFGLNRCIGAYFLDRDSGEIYFQRSGSTFICTGGHGRVYLFTSNPSSATGDGLAMGWRAGCKVANLEFMQFHPTCLFHPKAKSYLISEALRGEGAILRNKELEDFTRKYDERGSLAPRDIVARAIDSELKKGGDEFVYLDARAIGEEKLSKMFPNILGVCLQLGIDICKDLIPVVPAAHYSCGGLVVDQNGRTSVDGLYALGEVACTGLHGANRLASNSLLEALVFADFAAQDAVRQKETGSKEMDHLVVPDWNQGQAVPQEELVLLTHSWDEIRRLMWHYVGIVRSEKRLKRALDRITSLRQEIDEYYWDFKICEELLEVRNLSQVAWLTIRCAMARKESRGIHFNVDFPKRNDAMWGKDSIIW